MTGAAEGIRKHALLDADRGSAAGSADAADQRHGSQPRSTGAASGGDRLRRVEGAAPAAMHEGRRRLADAIANQREALAETVAEGRPGGDPDRSQRETRRGVSR